MRIESVQYISLSLASSSIFKCETSKNCELLLAKSRLLLPNLSSSSFPHPPNLNGLSSGAQKFLSSISSLVPRDLGSAYLSEKGLSLPNVPLLSNLTLVDQPYSYPNNPNSTLTVQQFCDEANDGQLGLILSQSHASTLSRAQKARKLQAKREWQEKRQNLGLYSTANSHESLSLDSYYAPLLVCYAHIVKQMNISKLSVDAASEAFLFHSQSFCKEKKYEPIVGIWRLLRLVASGTSLSPSLLWLQERYAEHIDQTVAQHPRALRPGSSQSVLERVICYSRIFIQSAFDSHSPSIAIGECVELAGQGGEVSFWTVVYFLIRIGQFSQALQWCNLTASPLANQPALRESLCAWLADEGSKPQSVPKSAFEGPLDTFKSLVLRLLTPPSSSSSSSPDQEFLGLEEERKRKSFSSIINKTECYLWFAFRTVSGSSPDSVDHSNNSNQALASHFLSLGSSYFGSGLGFCLGLCLGFDASGKVE